MSANDAVNPSRPPAEGGRDDERDDDPAANEAVNPDRPPAEGVVDVEHDAPEPNEPA